MEFKGNQNTNGLNLDSVNWQVQGNQLTWALNANIQSHDGNTFTYTNEMSNQVCVDFSSFKAGYRIVGLLNIIEQNRVVVFLVGPDGKGEIGVITNNGLDCITSEEVETDCGCVGGKVLSSTVTKVKNTSTSANPNCIYGIIYESISNAAGEEPAFITNYNYYYVDCNGNRVQGNTSSLVFTTVADWYADNGYTPDASMSPTYLASRVNVVCYDRIATIDWSNELGDGSSPRVNPFQHPNASSAGFDTFPCTSLVTEKSCCDYDAVLIDECCADCCQDCYTVTLQTINPTVPPGSSTGQVVIEYTDCNGNIVSIENPNNTFEGYGSFNMLKDSWRVIYRGTPGVDVVVAYENIYSTGNCNPCLDPSPSNCCLNFDIEYPIYATYRVDQCETRVYFVDKKNPPRYLSLERPLNRDACGESQDCGGKKLVTKKSCGELKIFPDTCHPKVTPIRVGTGGQLKAGTYQFAIAYTDDAGVELTDYFDFSQPIPIFEKKLTNLIDYVTNNAITVQIDHKVNIFDYFNLVVAETVQGVTTTYQLVGKYRVDKQFLQDVIIYTGEVKTTQSSLEPLVRTPYYKTAGIVESQNDILLLADLEKEAQYNFQPFANKLRLQWETVKMPFGDKWDYSNPEVACVFRTYQRDEVYAFGIKFKLKTGKYTEVYHIPGRAKDVVPGDTTSIPTSSGDNFIEEGDCLDAPLAKPKWEVYNTAGVGTTVTPVQPTELEKQFSCAILNDKRGEFAYWESKEMYPCNEQIWDTDAWGNALAGTPIRFHKFPDSNISHIHDGLHNSGSLFPNFDQQTNVFPIGVRVDAGVFNDLLNTLSIENTSAPESPYLAKDLICGYEIVYASRVGHKSVVAKGLLYDVGYFRSNNGEKEYYYPNYPFNDINWRGDSVVSDPYLRTSSDWYNKQDRREALGGDLNEFSHNGFVTSNTLSYKHKRFTFHSPDTHFSYPRIGSELKLETVEIGKVRGHFVEVEEHSKIKLFTARVSQVSGLLSTLLNIKDYTLDTSNLFNDQAMFVQLIEKFVPKINLAWQYNGVGKYNGYRTIANAGHKRRRVQFGNYAPSEILTFGQGEKPFHNRFRETSVYLSLNGEFDHHHSDLIDNSRYISSEDSIDNATDVNDSRTTRAYYGSIKDYRPSQYGPLTNLSYMSTGYSVDITTDQSGNARQIETFYPAFGGDTFINAFALKRKQSFFRQNLAGKPDDIPINYYLFPNLGYPTYFYGFNSNTIDVVQVLQDQLATLIVEMAAVGIIAAAIAYMGDAKGAGEIAMAAVLNLPKAALLDTVSDLLGGTRPFVFLDDDVTFTAPNKSYFYYKGKVYLFSYGIPVFFVESDVNVDFRHGRNEREENFYGAKELGEIPDQWLQEVNVPIKYDNFYHYNPGYSIQNKINPNFPYNENYPELYCETDLFNRVIYSDQGNIYGKTDPWLNFKRLNLYDFPKSTGKLIALNGIENSKVYARFENSTKLYNSIITLDSSNPLALELGDASMFRQKPIELSTSDVGYLGTQHKAFIKTTHGGFWVDARRGHVYKVGGSDGLEEISNKASMNWFKENLPFQIIKDIPEFPVDNTFKGIGIAMGWDERYHRVFVTKLDYKIKVQYIDDITYLNKKLYYNDVEIELGDLTYFENKSWTMSYNVLTKTWISFHSFIPNNYVSFIDHFQTVTKTSTWNHNLSPLTYQTYYNQFYPYIIEFAVNSAPNSATVNSVTYFQDVHKYYNRTEYYSLGSNSDKNTPNFTKAIIYNKEQVSGIVNLVPQLSNNARQRLIYPRVSGVGLEVLLSKRDHKNSFNGFWDATNNKKNFQNLFSTDWEDVRTTYPIDKVVNPKAVIYTTYNMGKQKIRATFCKVRLIQDKFNRYKFINNLQLTQINNSIT
jgi:hypothetical protein